MCVCVYLGGGRDVGGAVNLEDVTVFLTQCGLPHHRVEHEIQEITPHVDFSLKLPSISITCNNRTRMHAFINNRVKTTINNWDNALGELEERERGREREGEGGRGRGRESVCV